VRLGDNILPTPQSVRFLRFEWRLILEVVSFLRSFLEFSGRLKPCCDAANKAFSDGLHAQSPTISSFTSYCSAAFLDFAGGGVKI
jgi:hypothetical protein